MTSSFCWNVLTQTDTIVAGKGPTERRFVVPSHCLCVSPVIKDWIEDREAVPSSVGEKGDKALYFRDCEPEVMDLVIRYLKEEDGNNDYKLPPTDRDSLFYAKLYKLALCLGLEYLSLEALRNLRTRIRNVEDFAELAVSPEGTDLVSEEKFRRWFCTFIAEHSEQFLKSERLRTVICNGGQVAWQVYTVLISALSHAKEDYRSLAEPRAEAAPLTPPSSSPQKY